MSKKLEAHRIRRQHEANSASELMDRLPDNLQRATCKGSPVRRVHRHGCPLFPLQSMVLPFTRSFRDALCLQYAWHPPLMLSTCVCRKNFSVGNALSCTRGGFPSIEQNELCDII